MTQNKLGPLAPESVALLQRIIENIESGKFEHNQGRYHCGTAHCIAGWVVLVEYGKTVPLAENALVKVKVLNALDSDYSTDFGRKMYDWLRELVVPYTSNDPTWHGAANILGLTISESVALFSGALTLRKIKTRVASLAKGKRFVTPHGVSKPRWIDPLKTRTHYGSEQFNT